MERSSQAFAARLAMRQDAPANSEAKSDTSRVPGEHCTFACPKRPESLTSGVFPGLVENNFLVQSVSCCEGLGTPHRYRYGSASQESFALLGKLS